MDAFCELPVEGWTEVLFLWTKYDGEVLSTKASDGASTWEGSLNEEQFQVMASSCKMTMEAFLDETKKALSRKNMGNLVFVYSVTPSGDGMIELAWKKYLPSDGIKFQLGSIVLTSVSQQPIHHFLLSHSIDCMRRLQEKIRVLEGKCSRLSSERQVAFDELNKSCSLQDNLEKNVFGKFKLILNEKKLKIRKLMEQKSHLVEQNNEMQCQLLDAKIKDPSSSPSATDKVNATKEEQRSTNLSSGVAFESLLCDTACKPPSPPPAKRHRTQKDSGKGQVEIPRPPNLSGKMKIGHTEKSDSTEVLQMSVDSNELLDML